MAITVEERYGGREVARDRNGLISNIRVDYIVTGAETAEEAITATAGEAPTILESLIPSFRTTEQLSNDIWVVSATYSGNPKPSAAEDQGTLSFETVGSTQRITQSLETVASAGAVATKLAGAIGYDGENVQGVDIVTPQLTFSVSIEMEDADKPSLSTLYQATGTVNNATWRGFAAGEVLFLGVRGTRKLYGDVWDLTFDFSAIPNETGIVIGDLAPVDKKGHEYLWVQYGAAVDANLLVQTPIAVYVEKVYKESNFDLLGLGGAAS